MNCVELQALVEMYYGVCFITITGVCLFDILQHGGGMSHIEHHRLPDGYPSINEAYSQSRVNLQYFFFLYESSCSKLVISPLKWLNKNVNYSHCPHCLPINFEELTLPCHYCLTGRLERRLNYEARGQTQRIWQEVKIQIWFKVHGCVYHRQL